MLFTSIPKLFYLTQLFCSFTVFLLTFPTDDSDFLTIVTCCLCALIIVSALLVYGSFKVSTVTVTYLWVLDYEISHFPLEYSTLRGVLDFCCCTHCRDSIDGAFRRDTRCQHKEQWSEWQILFIHSARGILFGWVSIHKWHLISFHYADEDYFELKA